MQMGIHSQYSLYPHVNSHITSSQGARMMLLLWLKNPNCKSTAKECNADARLRLIIETIGNNNRYPTYKGLQRQNITRNLRFTGYQP